MNKYKYESISVIQLLHLYYSLILFYKLFWKTFLKISIPTSDISQNLTFYHHMD